MYEQPFTALIFICVLILVVYIIGFWAGREMDKSIERDRLKALSEEKANKNKKRR
tara:strand:- start:6964 stop:7128 length:165 start_codon:yes stop_codon:yes gene_type:complete